MIEFKTPNAATAAAKRALRQAGVLSLVAARTSRCANDVFSTALLMCPSTSEEVYGWAASALVEAGFTVAVYRDTDWVAATSRQLHD